MNELMFNSAMDRLPDHFPLSRVTMTAGIKKAFWDELKDYEDQDFIAALGVIVRQPDGKFPASPGVVRQHIEHIRLARLEEEHRKKKEMRMPTSYAAHDQEKEPDRAYVKNLAADTFAAVRAGLETGDMPGALRQLHESYGRENWMLSLASQIEYDRKANPPKKIDHKERGPAVCFRCKEKPGNPVYCKECEPLIWQKTAEIVAQKK